MDGVTTLSQYLSLGLGGVLAVGLLWMLHHVITVTLPDKDKLFTASMSEARQNYLSSLNGIETKFAAVIDRHGDRMERTSDKIVDGLTNVREAVLLGVEASKNNKD